MKTKLLFIFILASFTLGFIPPKAFSQSVSGQWKGHLIANDPATGQKNTYWLKINFDENSAYSNYCGNGGNRGIIKFLNETLLEIHWSGCGIETISIDMNDNRISGVGSFKAQFDGRIIPSKWDISKVQQNEIWQGRYITNDISVGQKQYFTLKIDFNNNIAYSDCYGYGKIVGKVTRTNSSLIEIYWPGCGTDNVSIELNGEEMNAVGSNRAVSNGRTIPIEWSLKRIN